MMKKELSVAEMAEVVAKVEAMTSISQNPVPKCLLVSMNLRDDVVERVAAAGLLNKCTMEFVGRTGKGVPYRRVEEAFYSPARVPGVLKEA